MISIKDIATKANVSIATVSNVLNNNGRVGEKTRKKILQIIEEENYKPNNIAKSLKLKKTGTIGVIVEDISVFNAPEIIDGINDYAETNGYSILLTNMRLFKKVGNDYPSIDECKEMVLPLFHQLLGNQVEGIIYIGIHLRDVTGLLPDSNTPIVYTYCDTTDEQEYSVTYDDYAAAYQSTKYLIDKGHEDIGLISGLINSASSHARFNGYHKALMDYNVSFNPAFVKTGDWQYESGYSMTKDLLQQNKVPTAIMAMNDLMAGGVIEAAKDTGYKIPYDLSVVGFDNRELSNYSNPRLTTVSLPLSEMGKTAMEILVSAINEDPIVTKKYKLQCKLIERDTVFSFKND